MNDKDIVTVKGGIHHSIALSNQGQLYAFGRGDSGQLGVSEMIGKAAGAFSDTPCHINLPQNNINDKVISIACGGNHNLAITANNDIYSWGYGDMLALGHGEEKDENLPKKMNLAKSKLGHVTVSQVSICVVCCCFERTTSFLRSHIRVTVHMSMDGQRT